MVLLFALLHDAFRHHDGHDGEHGLRAAEFTRELDWSGRIYLDPDGLYFMLEACRTHAGSRTPAHPTVMAGWDSDHLDLPLIWSVRVRPE